MEVALLGDSFAHGNCVPQGDDLASRLGASSTVLNLGMGGNGPMLMLAGLSEFLSEIRPPVVLWLYYEGNDLYNLRAEGKNRILRRYLEDPVFRQGLARQQTAIAKLTELRRRLSLLGAGGVQEVERSHRQARAEAQRLALFAEILEEARDRVAAWGGELELVYLPAWHRYHSGFERFGDRWDGPFRHDVLAITDGLDIPIIDLHHTFATSPDRSNLFGLGPHYPAHYSPAGYRVAAQAIAAALADGRPAGVRR
ncbi:MAG TPA: SGNH/GDSL hydrolase family protein [Thermoanaerobaculia bacterium]|nr:SGNH/GDSL hydrolase family protein [Thermoanaerobaculia bacterium]